MLLAVVAALTVAVAVLVVEVRLARRGSMLDAVPLVLDGRVGGATGDLLDVVWVGDSTAAGVGASAATTALPVLVAAELGRPVELTVVARSGASVADVVAFQLPALDRLDPDVVFVSVGANDVTSLTSREDFARGYRRLAMGLPSRARIVLLGVPDMGAAPRLAQPLRALAGWRGEQLDEIVRRTADDTGSTYVDIAGQTGPDFRADPERFFAADDYHPSDEGYRRWAAAVLGEVRSTMLAS